VALKMYVILFFFLFGFFLFCRFVFYFIVIMFLKQYEAIVFLFYYFNCFCFLNTK